MKKINIILLVIVVLVLISGCTETPTASVTPNQQPDSSKNAAIKELKSALANMNWNHEKYNETAKFYDWVVNSTAPCGDPMICPDRQVIKGSSVSGLVEAKLKEIREENATGNATGQEAGWFLVFSEYLTGLRTLNVYFASHDLANVSKSAVDKQAAEQWKEKARKYFNESKKYHDSLEDLNSRFLRLEIELKSLEGN